MQQSPKSPSKGFEVPHFTKNIPTYFDFSTEEYLGRFSKILGAVDGHDLDCALLTRAVDFRWGCGYRSQGHPFELLCVPHPKYAGIKPFFFTRLCERANADNLPVPTDIAHYEDNQHPIEVLGGELRKRGLCVGKLLKEFPDAEIVNFSRAIEQFRILRSEEEIAIYRRSAHLTEAGTQAGLDRFRVGISENELVAAITNVTFAADDGCRWSFEGHRCSGVTHFRDGTVEQGQLLFLEVGASYKSYHTSMMRTAYIGAKIPDWLQEAEDLINEALDYLITNMRKGAIPEELDAAAREIIGRRTFEATQTTRCGYTIGAGTSPEWSDADFSLVAGERRPLQVGQVFHVIPFVQTPHGCIGFSETVLVTEEGGHALTGHVVPRKVHHVIPSPSAAVLVPHTQSPVAVEVLTPESIQAATALRVADAMLRTTCPDDLAMVRGNSAEMMMAELGPVYSTVGQ